MEFYADVDNPASLKRVFFNSIWILLLTGILYGGFSLAIIYHDGGFVRFLVMSIIMFVVLYRLSISKFIAQDKILNHYITYTKIDRHEISLTTLRVSIFFGVFVREPLEVSIKNKRIRLRKASENYGNKKYTGQVYLLSYGMEEFAIAEKFFDDIESLLGAVESYIKTQNQDSDDN